MTSAAKKLAKAMFPGLKLGRVKAPKGTAAQPVNVTIKRDPKKKKKPIGIMKMYPSVKYTTLLWAQSTAVNTSATQSQFGTALTFRLNSIIQPNVTAPQFAVQGYNQINGIYNRYKVYGAKVKVTFNNPLTDGIYWGVRAHNSEGVADALAGEVVGQADMKKWTIAKPLNNTGSQVAVYERYWDIAKMDGLNKYQFLGDIYDYSAIINANPSNQPILEICCANTQATGQTALNFKIEIVYYTQLYERTTFPSSASP